MSRREEHLQVAHSYYILHQSAAEIAARLSIPVSRVQRLLRESLENGIVQVSIPEWEESLAAMSAELERRLGLKEVVIAELPPQGDVLDAIAAAGNRTLQKLLREGQIVGLSHGRAVATLVARMLPAERPRNLTVTRLVGALGNTTLTVPSDDIARLCADKLGANISLLFAPLILKNAHLRRALLEEPLLQEAFRVMSGADIALLGIGGADYENPMLRESLSAEDHAILAASGAVGEICTHYFNSEGKSVRGPLGRHVIAIEEKTLKAIPCRIGLAGGPDKLEAIRGACRGKYINILVTDEGTARALLGRPAREKEETPC